MREKKIHSESGFTLLEILIVLTLISIVSAIAISQFATSKTNLQRQGIAREFKIYLERARFDSVKRRAVNNDMSETFIRFSLS